MPVTKAEAEAKRLEKKKSALQVIEHDLDLALIKGTRNISISRVPFYLRQVVKERYERAGWKIKCVYDQRDGDYWEFS